MAKGILIKAPEVRISDFTLHSRSSLICHRWAEKAKQEMLDKHMKKAAKAKAAKDPEADFQASLYLLPNGGYGFPAVAFKAAAVRAGTLLGLRMTDTRQMFYVIAEDDELVRINGTPTIREDMVRLNGKTADIRHRGEFIEWTTTLRVQYIEDFITEEQIANLLEIAGMSVGVGEWRPEKNGIHGMWTLIDPN